ncbi:MAG: hypothetical protein H6974_04410 [Gammaproteobacteria bacterium]|nr:hypothetical protein [Gammaproteobacteria bacterium]MCP5196024.1 hypothetical protein [Gammaproteobacteria bacterium]
MYWHQELSGLQFADDHQAIQGLNYGHDHSVADGLDSLAIWNAAMLLIGRYPAAAVRQKRPTPFAN